MSSTLLQRHLCFNSRLRTGQQAWVSTTSAINRGLRATRDEGGSYTGGRDRFKRAPPSTSRTASRDRPSFGDRRKLSDHVELGRDSRSSGRPDRNAQRDSYGSSRPPGRDRDRPSGFRDRDRPSGFRDRQSSRPEPRERTSSGNRRRLSDSVDLDNGPTSSARRSGGDRFSGSREFDRERPASGRSRPRDDYSSSARDRGFPQERQGGRNRAGQRTRRERAISASDSSTPHRRQHAEAERDENGRDDGKLPRELRKHIKNAARQVFFIQEKQATGEDVRDLISDVKFALKNINKSEEVSNDHRADAIVDCFRTAAKEGTFLAGDLPTGEKSVIYITEEGTLDIDVVDSPDVTKAPNRGKAAYMEEKAKVRAEPKPVRRQQRTRSDEDDEEISEAVPYTTAASEFLYGYNSVLAALRAKRRQCYKLYIHPKIFEREMGGEGTQSGEKPASELVALAKAAKVPFVNEFRTALLSQMSGDRPHNGVVLETSKLPAPPVLGLMKPELRKGIIPVELGQQTEDEAKINGAPRTIRSVGSTWRHPFVLLLDGITDPGNLGNIIRTAHFYGVDAVAVATNTCANLSSAVLAKASSGACEAMQILAVPSASGFIHSCSRYRWKIYGAVAPILEDGRPQHDDQHLTSSTLAANSPLAKNSCILMLGAEGEGLRPNLRARADKFVSIEGGPRAEGIPDVGVDSMNVGVATGVLLEAFLRKPTDAPDNIVAQQEDALGF